MALSDYGRNLVLTALGNAATYVSLHLSDPNVNSAVGEASGGGYARQPMAWNTTVTGDLDTNSSAVFSVLGEDTLGVGNATYTHFGMWDAPTGGNFIGGAALSAEETFTAAGTYTLTDADVFL